MADFGGSMSLNIEQKIGRNLTLTELVLFSTLNNRYPQLRADPYFFQGSLGVTELSVYAANKLYVCLSLTIVPLAYGASTVVSTLEYYNETNVLVSFLRCGYPYWDPTAVAAVKTANTDGFSFKNFYFSRLSITSGNPNFIFVGYRLTI